MVEEVEREFVKEKVKQIGHSFCLCSRDFRVPDGSYEIMSGCSPWSSITPCCLQLKILVAITAGGPLTVTGLVPLVSTLIPIPRAPFVRMLIPIPRDPPVRALIPIPRAPVRAFCSVNGAPVVIVFFCVG
ncbi:hypothetical protein ACFX2F_031878 [Malus domestica]